MSSASTPRAATAQYEFDFEYSPALEMADKITFFRLMVSQVAKSRARRRRSCPSRTRGRGVRAHHFNMSIADLETGREPLPRRRRRARPGWSKVAYGFVAGIMRHARGDRRGRHPDGQLVQAAGAAPRRRHGVVGAGVGRVRRQQPLVHAATAAQPPAVENRGVDSAANTYLAAAFMLAAGLEGIREGLDPGDPIEDITYDWKAGPPGAARLPRNLLEAIEAFDADPLVHDVFPAAFVQRVLGDEARRVGRVPRAGHRLGARPLPATF